MNQKPSVEDVLIGPNRTVKKKSKLPKIIIIFILILLLAGGGYFAYNYYTNFMVEKTKTKFFRYLSTNNIESLFDNEIYNTLIEKLQNQTNHSSLNLTATSSFKNEYDLDISKFNVIFNQITDKNQEKDFAELNVKYADNDLISARVINNKNSIAIASDEIADKYIGVNKSNIKKILENNVSSNIISEVDKIGTNDSEENELTDDYKSEKVNEYFKYIYDSIPEENFTERENILINTEDENNLNSKCYEFNTTYLQINNMYINILEKLKNDVDLLNNVAKANNVQENNTVVDTNTTFTSKNTTIDITPMKTTETEDSTIDDILIIKDIISGKKVDKTVDELQEMLENMIDEANTSSVNNTELKISQYVVNEKLKKITIKSIDLNIEIDFLSENNREKIKLTVLTADSNLTNSLGNLENEFDSENTDNAIDTETSTSESTGINNGFTIKIEKITSDMSTKINAEVGIVTNLEINTKLSLALTTTGTSNSKDIKNQSIITFTTQEGQLIATLNYNANFENSTTAIDDLTDENCLFLDTLSDEDYQNITAQIMDRITTVIDEKKVVLNLIDQNNNTSIIGQGNTNNTQAKDDARQKIIDVVTGMMADVQNRGEVFTLNNLVGLQIEGYEVSCSVNENIATIVVNGYTFYIDSDFNLTEE